MSLVVVDTSALIAILLGEPDASVFRDALESADNFVMSAFTRFELGVVMLGRRGQAGTAAAEALVTKIQIGVWPFDQMQASVALKAYARYGKGADPKARLNLADCAAYALAKTLDAPLLFKGDDFTHTDVTAAA